MGLTSRHYDEDCSEKDDDDADAHSEHAGRDTFVGGYRDRGSSRRRVLTNEIKDPAARKQSWRTYTDHLAGGSSAMNRTFRRS